MCVYVLCVQSETPPFRVLHELSSISQDNFSERPWLQPPSPTNPHKTEATSIMVHRRLQRNSFQISLLSGCIAWGQAWCILIPEIFEEEIISNILGQPDNALASCPTPGLGIKRHSSALWCQPLKNGTTLPKHLTTNFGDHIWLRIEYKLRHLCLRHPGQATLPLVATWSSPV